MNDKDACVLNIRPKPGDIRHRMNTANGITEVIITVADSLKVGNIVVKNVEVAIDQNNRLSTSSLLGMSFLSKIKFYTDKGNLIMEEQ